MYEDDHESDDEAPLLSSINKRINIRDSGSFIPDDAEEKVHHVANQRSNKANPSNTSHISQFTVGQHAAMASYWFGWSFLWLPLLIVLIPFQVAHIAGPGTCVMPSFIFGSHRFIDGSQL